MNGESVEMYHAVFLRVFQLIEEKTGVQVHWRHIHGDGYAAAVMDMDTKQVPGKMFQIYN